MSFENKKITEVKKKIINLLLKDLDYSIQYEDIPMQRATLSLINGNVDIEIGRSYDFKKFSPKKIFRINENLFTVSFNAYSTKDIMLECIEDIRFYSLSYLEGMSSFDKIIRKYQIDENIYTLVNSMNLFKFLELERTELIFASKYEYNEYLEENPDTKVKLIKENFISLDLYIYVSKNRVDLVPILEKRLKKLKTLKEFNLLLEK